MDNNPIAEVFTVTIPNGESRSTPVILRSPQSPLYGLRLYGLIMPSSGVSMSISFLTTFNDGMDWHPVKDAEGLITVSADANDCIVWRPEAFSKLSVIKLQSGSLSAPVVQTSARDIKLLLGRA